jgi:hypothetical protein
LAKAIVKDVIKLLNKKNIEDFEVDDSIRFELESFSTVDGEGVAATVINKTDKT